MKFDFRGHLKLENEFTTQNTEKRATSLNSQVWQEENLKFHTRDRPWGNLVNSLKIMSFSHAHVRNKFYYSN
jgi:hypothetical protein